MFIVLEQTLGPDCGKTEIVGYTLDHTLAVEEMTKRATQVLENLSILGLEVFKTGSKEIVLAAPFRKHGITFTFQIVEVPEILRT